jgi:transcriptional regulator with XRE-family HTH domain
VIALSISENIKKLRKRYDLTQQDLADIAGVTNKAVSAWESELSEPRMGAIEKMANRFGIKKSNIIEDGGMDLIDSDPLHTIAAHHDGEAWTEEELEEIERFKEFVKSRRQQKGE